MKECSVLFFSFVTFLTRQNWFCSNENGKRFQTQAKPGNFQPSVLSWVVSNWKEGIDGADLSWSTAPAQRLCPVLRATTGLLAAFVGVIAVDSAVILLVPRVRTRAAAAGSAHSCSIQQPGRRRAEERSWWADIQKIIWLTKCIKRFLEKSDDLIN